MKLITTNSAAKILGVTPVRVRQLIQQGQLASVKHGRDHLLEEEIVHRFNREGRRPGGRPHTEYLIRLGMPRERIFLGYDAVDNRYFEDKVAAVRSQLSVVRRRYGLPERYFLASARFVEKKNLARLLEAYARYRKLCEDQRRQNSRTPELRAAARSQRSASRRLRAARTKSAIRNRQSAIYNLQSAICLSQSLQPRN
jgi:excisionase family DNA binding protein